jgi:NDP-sugar pyrophosphorylase family protein
MWVNGSFFVVKPVGMIWEHDRVARLAAEGHLYAYEDNGFWQCMEYPS